MKIREALSAALVIASFASVGAAEGFGILNAYEPTEGVVFGGQLTEEQLAALAAASFKSIIDLRGEDEDRGYDEAAAVKNLGLEYLPLPVTEATLREEATFDRFIELFATAEKPLLVHCASGNRVGALYYAFLVARDGMTREDALAVAKANGLRSMALVEPVNRYLDQR